MKTLVALLGSMVCVVAGDASRHMSVPCAPERQPQRTQSIPRIAPASTPPLPGPEQTPALGRSSRGVEIDPEILRRLEELGKEHARVHEEIEALRKVVNAHWEIDSGPWGHVPAAGGR